MKRHPDDYRRVLGQLLVLIGFGMSCAGLALLLLRFLSEGLC